MRAKLKAGPRMQTRLLATTTLVLAVFLTLTGVVLDRSFTASTLTGAEEQMRLVIYSLMGAAETEGGRVVLRELPEPRLLQPESGLYAAISEPGGEYHWRSPSALTTAVEFPELEILLGEFLFSRDQASGRFVLTYAVIWEDADETMLIFQVAADQVPFVAAIRSFRQNLYVGVSVVTLLVLGVQVVAIRWGLKPLRIMAEEVRELEDGQRDGLSSTYPQELQGLADNLSRFVVHEQRSRARYRNALDDLAHSLKTPLAVMRNALGTGSARGHPSQEKAQPGIAREHPSQEKAQLGSASGHPSKQKPPQPGSPHIEAPPLMAEQLDRMEEAVHRQLSRATVAGPLVVAKPVDVRSVLRRLARALQTAHQDRAISLDLDLADDLMVRGDERDFMDLFGNILENAFKYTHRRVLITASAGPRTVVSVEDDGAGIDPEIRGQVIDRGIRADRAHPGQGIGLAVVAELTALYDGSLEIDSSRFGGARVTVTL